MDIFKLEILRQNILHDTLFTEEEYYLHIKTLSTANLSFTERVQLNLALRRVPLIISNKALNNELRAFFPYYKTGSGGR